MSNFDQAKYDEARARGASKGVAKDLATTPQAEPKPKAPSAKKKRSNKGAGTNRTKGAK